MSKNRFRFTWSVELCKLTQVESKLNITGKL